MQSNTHHLLALLLSAHNSSRNKITSSTVNSPILSTFPTSMTRDMVTVTIRVEVKVIARFGREARISVQLKECVHTVVRCTYIALA